MNSYALAQQPVAVLNTSPSPAQSFSSPQFPASTTTTARKHVSKHQFTAELSQCVFDFILELLPTPEELAVKEDVRKLLERLIRTIEPDSRLLSFGSTANGFSIRNSDMDLCCLIDSDERLSAADLVTMLGDLLERETKFRVKPLPHARIPIVKLSLDPSPGLPHGIACDIGFENRLALENTRLLMCYGMIDPERVKTMVLFLKVWCKRRKINSPYKGTLSSYGYVLLVIYFLVHVKNPPVLPNLQQIPPLRPIPREELFMGGNHVWFFDDIDVLRQRWQSSNRENVAELLIDFFRYFAREFPYNTGVASIRAGLIKKDVKGWSNDLDSKYDSRERNRFCIEDPFETDFNVARCVTKDGLYTLRGEFMRASRILAARPDRAVMALAMLCEEREDEELVPFAPPRSFVPPRVPPQTPYGVGSNSLRPNGNAVGDRLSPPKHLFEEGARPSSQVVVVVPPSTITPPEHMAPKRAKWTSPPPPSAPADDHSVFESTLNLGLAAATASTDAREDEKAEHSSSSNSEVLTDEDHSPLDVGQDDDVKSVRSLFMGSPQVDRTASKSFVKEPASSLPRNTRLQEGLELLSRIGVSQPNEQQIEEIQRIMASRGRRATRPAQAPALSSIPSNRTSVDGSPHLSPVLPAGNGISRRSVSGPHNLQFLPGTSTLSLSAQQQRLSLSPANRIHCDTSLIHPNRSGVGYPTTPQSPVNPFSLYRQQYYMIPGALGPEATEFNRARQQPQPNFRQLEKSLSHVTVQGHHHHMHTDLQKHHHHHASHSHSHSNSTVVAPSAHPGPPDNGPPTPPPETSPSLAPFIPFNPFHASSSPICDSIESSSPPSTNSSPVQSSVGCTSPMSSFSPRTVDFGSPIFLSGFEDGPTRLDVQPLQRKVSVSSAARLQMPMDNGMGERKIDHDRQLRENHTLMELLKQLRLSGS